MNGLLINEVVQWAAIAVLGVLLLRIIMWIGAIEDFKADLKSRFMGDGK